MPFKNYDDSKSLQYYYLGFLRQHAPKLSTRRFSEAHALLEAELPNIRAAWEWASEERRQEQLKDSAFALHKLLEVGSRDGEAVELFSRAAERLDEENPEHHAALGYALIGQGAVHRAADGAAGDGASVPASDLIERALALLRPLGEELGVALALSWLAIIHSHLGDVAGARKYHLEGFPLARRVGNPHILGRYLNGQVLYWRSESVDEDAKLLERVIRDQRELGDPFHLLWALTSLGSIFIQQLSFAKGKVLLRETLELNREYGIPSGLSTTLQRSS